MDDYATKTSKLVDAQEKPTCLNALEVSIDDLFQAVDVLSNRAAPHLGPDYPSDPRNEDSTEPQVSDHNYRLYKLNNRVMSITQIIRNIAGRLES